MNISPVNLVNLKSGLIKNKNEQNFKQKNTAATSPISNNKISSETLKAYYCPQISFKGNDDNNDEIQLSDGILYALGTCVRITTGKRLEIMNPELYEKLKNGTATKEELVQLLKIPGKAGNTVAHVIAERTDKGSNYSKDENPNEDLYHNITKDLSEKDRVILLKTTNNSGRSIADTLRFKPCFKLAMKDIQEEDKLDILKYPSYYHDPYSRGENKICYISRRPIAGGIAYNTPHIYCEITENISHKGKLELLKTANSTNGVTVAHELARADEGKYFNEATKDLTYKERLELLKIAANGGYTVAHFLANYNPEEFYNITKDFSDEDISILLKMKTYYEVTVESELPKGHELYVQRRTLDNLVTYTRAIKRLSPEEKFEILNMSNNFKTVFKKCDLNDPKQQEAINRIIMNLMGIEES